MSSTKYRNNKYKAKDEGAARNQKILQARMEKKSTKQKNDDVKTLNSVIERYKELEKINTASIKLFSDLPLSPSTLKGLEECEYTTPTEIQRDSLPFSLTGSDLVAAAKTGSGKTLALVIPLLECLWKASWSLEYGLGAIIISPTRELALQTYSCINSVGKYHSFSCALLIGGTDVKFERNRIGGVNIIVCTPGRLLQHMDENNQLSCDDLQMLVIDEADRILDMGFAQQINAIVENLPQDRQTLLFSATQTRNVKDLCRVCAKDPVFVSVHEKSLVATPDTLKQSYMLCEEEEKINLLFGFVVNHKKLKTLVFVSSCRQARFITEVFCKLQPGVSIMGLWGTMNQTKRIDVFKKFEDRESAVLIATDVASRGLDFSNVDWVLQLDCPATIEDYIHRVGRTARMEREGQAVLVLTPKQEEGMLKLLKTRGISLERIRVASNSIKDISDKLQQQLTEHQHLNDFAKMSLIAYIRSVYLMRNKSIFDVQSIDTEKLAASYGLVAVPRIRFLSKKGIAMTDKKSMAENMKKARDAEVRESGGKSENKKKESLVGKFELQGPLVDDDDLFTVKKADVFHVLDGEDEDLSEVLKKKESKNKKTLTKKAAAKLLLNKKIKVNTKKVFDEEGETAVEDGVSERLLPSVGLDLQEAIDNMKEQDKEDRKRKKELKRKEKQELKLKKKLAAQKEEDLDIADEDGGGSGVNSDADLDWLPDPDEVRARYAREEAEEDDEQSPVDEVIEEPPKKKKRKQMRATIAQKEKEALALLNPFG